MKRNLFLSFFLFSGIGLIAQEIDISKFVLPEYKRSALEFNFSSSNSGNLSKTKEDTGSISYKSQSVSTGNSGYINFSRISNNLKYQGNISTSLELGIPSLSKSWNKHTMVELENSTRRYSFGFDFTSANRFYSSKKKYFEIDPTIVINNSSYRHFSEAFYTDPASNYNNLIKNSDLNLNLESDFRVGVGRVEPVEDMRQVLYILEDLKTAGRLKRELSQEETIQLAEKLAVLKNKRFLDSRLRLIEETIEIEKILSEMDLITEYDALFFATVNDYWSMAPNPGRSSGKRISLGVKPSYNSSQYKNYTELQEFSPDTITSDEYLNLENGFRVNFSAFYENYKPLDFTTVRL